MAKVVIFGIQDFAELAHFYLSSDSDHEVVAFSVNEQYLPVDRNFCGLPVIPFEQIELIFSPHEYSFFAPMAPTKMNTVRENVYRSIKEKGYQLINYISSKATLFNNRIGDNCFVLEDNTIQPFTTIGNNVILWSGNHIGHHSVIKNNIIFTSQVVLSGHCVVNDYCVFGVNSTIRDGLKIAEGTFVAMGACLIQDSEPWSMYKGNPAIKSSRSTKDF